MKKKSFLFLVIAVYLVFFPWGCSKKTPGSADLSPAAWPEGELEKYARLNRETNVPKPPVEADEGMVVGAFSPLAIRSGMEALKKGGSAADAALTTALAQVCLLAGSNVSYSAVMFMVYYEAKTGKTYSLHAGWNTVQEEKDPMSIPLSGTPSGRQVLVPGFMAGASLIQAFNLLELADLRKYGHYTRSAEALYQFIQISRGKAKTFGLCGGNRCRGKYGSYPAFP
jgi:gamma-glutamyltranspeptidase